MVNKPHVFRDRDIKRVVKAVKAAGVVPTAIEVEPKSGKIRVVLADNEAMPAAMSGNEWDGIDGPAEKAAPR
jgi:hypothetical protein